MFRVSFRKCFWTEEEAEVNRQTDLAPLGLDRAPDGPGSEVAVFVRDLELPFAPYPGLTVSDKGWESGEIQTVEWRGDDGVFRCRVRDEFPGQADDMYLSYEELIELAFEEGWVRPPRGGGNSPRIGVTSSGT